MIGKRNDKIARLHSRRYPTYSCTHSAPGAVTAALRGIEPVRAADCLMGGASVLGRLQLLATPAPYPFAEIGVLSGDPQAWA